MRTRIILAAAAAIAAWPALAESPVAEMTAEDLASGEKLFRVHCARCHGMDGAGGEGANLAKPVLRHAKDDEALAQVIALGIPGTAMPAVWAIDPSDLPKVAGYVRSLGRLEQEAMPGDPVRGADIFRSRGGCPACHIVDGLGKGVGPELSTIGDQRGRDYLRRSLLAPAEAQPQTLGYRDYLTVRVDSGEGGVEGLRVNEDAFSIQVRDVSGTVHSFRKDELESYERVFAHSLMPEYGSALADEDIDDVVSYLMSLRSEP